MNPALKHKAHVSEAKKKIVENLSNLFKENKTFLICSIKNIPASQFQKIKKSLRGKAIVKVPKKSLINLAIDNQKDNELLKIKEKIGESIAILFSNLDAFELARELLETKTPAKAKPGQIAPEDIEIHEGPTDLIPGPAVSDLGALGIQIKIEKGKIHIKESKIIVHEGEEISEIAADMMSKLDIKPFKIGFIPLAAFDNVNKKLYLNIEIDKDKYLAQLKEAYSKALPFAVEISYFCRDTIKYLLMKANTHAKAIEKLSLNKEEKPSEKEIKNEDSSKSETENNASNKEIKSEEKNGSN